MSGLGATNYAFPLHISKHSITCDLISVLVSVSILMASVALNVITGTQNNNAVVLQPASRWGTQPFLFQIRRDEDQNRVVTDPGGWDGLHGEFCVLLIIQEI